ncbi:MAG: DEAD/DEAH box helicase [Gammaproteobacteria bacterium]|jgi:hypothetical protein
MSIKTKKRKKTTRKKQNKLNVQGWRTSDEQEIERRRQRGAAESFRIETLAKISPFLGDFRVLSGNGGGYTVEVRSLSQPLNTCDCPDHAVNRLGTCKHVEAVLHKLAKGKKRAFQQAAAHGSPLVEIFHDRRDDQIRILWPQRSRPRSKIRTTLEPFFAADNSLMTDAPTALPALRRRLANVPKALRDTVRISRQIDPWLDRLTIQANRRKTRADFEQDVARGKRTMDVVKVPLYRYQQQGMLHLAFTERALLADEMGLGKTVQAIAACELLRRSRGVEKVLVICPASLKAEWEEQIAKFTALPSLIIQGSRANRLKQYRQPAFFLLANYEQILGDAQDIQQIVAPDIVILDEAQRIKNWQTKTANAVKRLQSRYAFVLTGTPLENRIDEIYSIVQFLDPHVFGPLFRFNRDFYQLDENGHPTGYKNLDELHRRLRPVMLRRRKHEVEGELPGRTVNNYFVSMTDEQALRYEEYNLRVARLVAQMGRRPLRKEEWEMLQQWLACMRMLCDTPYILDPQCDDSPKLEELEKILGELLEEGDHKVIIFSEWTRMLELVAGLADTMKTGYALHTGAISQPKRRQEIRRFKDDPSCRLFLSSDAGSTGLNLQNADVVINIDLPWNPAKLEQRIARAWRKHQTRAVQVINLVCEHSIEHRILHLLAQKQELANEVVDGLGQQTFMAMPSGRAAFMERVQLLMGHETVEAKPESRAVKAGTDPLQRLREDTVSQWNERLDLLQVHEKDSKKTVLAVVDKQDSSLQAALQNSVNENLPGEQLEILDRTTYDTIQRLIKAGVLSLNQEGCTLHQSPTVEISRRQARENEHNQRLNKARARFAQAERKHDMAQVLAKGGFIVEAMPALGEAVEGAIESLAKLYGHDFDHDHDHDQEQAPLSIAFIESRLVEAAKAPPNTVTLVAQLRESDHRLEEQQAHDLLNGGGALLQHVSETINKATLQ